MLGKVCTECNKFKTWSLFPKSSYMKDGYRSHCKECINRRSREYKRSNKEKIKQYNREYKSNRKNKNRRNFLSRERMKTDLNYKLNKLLRKRMKRAVKDQVGVFSSKTIDMLGCSVLELKEHLQSLFLEGMTWDNHTYDGWHIDHIKPCSSFDLTDIEQQKECFHYTNLQPLWAEDNLTKGSKYHHDT